MPDELSLAEALRLAREHNPAYRKALAELEVAAADERRAWGTLLPTLNLGLSTGMTQFRTLTGLDNFGRPVRIDEPAVFTRTSSLQPVSLGSFRLCDGGSRRCPRSSAS